MRDGDKYHGKNKTDKEQKNIGWIGGEDFTSLLILRTLCRLNWNLRRPRYTRLSSGD